MRFLSHLFSIAAILAAVLFSENTHAQEANGPPLNLYSSGVPSLENSDDKKGQPINDFPENYPVQSFQEKDSSPQRKSSPRRNQQTQSNLEGIIEKKETHDKDSVSSNKTESSNDITTGKENILKDQNDHKDIYPGLTWDSVLQAIKDGNPKQKDIEYVLDQAGKGNGKALEILGFMRVVGLGLERDYLEAYLAYGKAFKAGELQVRGNLNELWGYLSNEQRQQVKQTFPD